MFVTFGQFINSLGLALGWSVGLIGLASTARQLTNMPPGWERLTDWAGLRKVITVGVSDWSRCRLNVRVARRERHPKATMFVFCCVVRT